MRGRAVPTMVWSSAARNSASATPIVARMRALRVIPAGIGGLLGHGFDRVVEIRQRHAQACALLGGGAPEHAGHAPPHDLAVLFQPAAAPARQRRERGTPTRPILE